MSCPNNETTKLKTRKKETCKDNCSFNFSYNPNSSCILTNKGDYLDIKTDGNNKVTYNNQDITLQSVRLYSPSLHSFDGKHTDAELILRHSGANGQNIMVSVPIMAKEGAGQSMHFFSQLSKFIPLSKGEKQNIQVSNWSLDDAMPGGKAKGAPFYHYSGSSPYPPCKMKATIIIFDIEHASTIKPSDLSLIKKSIKATSSNDKEGFIGREGFVGREGMVTYNSSGANSNNKDTGEDEALECVEFYDTGDTSSNKNDNSSKSEPIDWSKIYESPTFIFIVFIILCFIGWIVIKFVIPKFIKKVNGSSDIGAAPEPTIPPNQK
jgi:carbonic anhydrase